MAQSNNKKPSLIKGWVIYLRTSSEEAQAPERSQSYQRRLVMDRLVSESKLPLLSEYIDTFSGRSTDRQHYQRLLEDARLGKFSHGGIAFVDRFGRNDVEGIRAIDELTKLGIDVRIATYPSLDPSTPDGRMIVGMLFTVARFESDRNGQRTREGMLTKLLNGDWPWLAPDGYLNKEEKLNLASPDRASNGRYKRWVELDPIQSSVWRDVWELLWREWTDRRQTLTASMKELNQKTGFHIANLDAALTLISRIGILYGRLDKQAQKDLLRHLVKRIVVDRSGAILQVDLHPPFEYLVVDHEDK